jgi:elongation factor P
MPYGELPNSHTQPGKGGAYIQAEMKNITNQSKLNERFRSAESIEKIRAEEINHQFLFRSGDDFTFMNNQTYEQIVLNTDQVNEETAKFLQDGMEVSIEFYDEKPMTVNPPENLVVEIAETEAVVKGQTASSSYKPALLTNGVRITVPPHIETGDKIKINTKDLTYIEKSK